MEAARWWGTYTMSSWYAEAPIFRARITAHWLHMTMRTSYEQEKMFKDASKGKTGGTPAAVLAHLGI